jgi:hypothetical protein
MSKHGHFAIFCKWLFHLPFHLSLAKVSANAAINDLLLAPASGL